MRCFSCDEDGHMARQCGQVTGLRDHDPLGIHRRAAWEVSEDPRGWADKIFAAMGWSRTGRVADRPLSSRELAALQVAAARAAREIC